MKTRSFFHLFIRYGWNNSNSHKLLKLTTLPRLILFSSHIRRTNCLHPLAAWLRLLQWTIPTSVSLSGTQVNTQRTNLCVHTVSLGRWVLQTHQRQSCNNMPQVLAPFSPDLMAFAVCGDVVGTSACWQVLKLLLSSFLSPSACWHERIVENLQNHFVWTTFLFLFFFIFWGAERIKNLINQYKCTSSLHAAVGRPAVNKIKQRHTMKLRRFIMETCFLYKQSQLTRWVAKRTRGGDISQLEQQLIATWFWI